MKVGYDAGMPASLPEICIEPIRCGRHRYKQRNGIQIMFAGLKDRLRQPLAMINASRLPVRHGPRLNRPLLLMSSWLYKRDCFSEKVK